ncbi:MAG: MaoC family dehydratase [Alphaproteobacteria bacterium]
MTAYFEDFEIGQTYCHRRARTFSQEENARWSLQTMNTAEAHWNFEAMRTYMNGAFDRPLMNAAIVIAVSVGLSSQDMSEQIVADLELDSVRIPVPAFPGDTIRVESRVLGKDDDPERPDAGILRYSGVASNQRNEVVCTFVRAVSIKKRAGYKESDDLAMGEVWSNVGR